MRIRRNTFTSLPTTAVHRFPANPTPSSSSSTGSLIQPPLPPIVFSGTSRLHQRSQSLGHPSSYFFHAPSSQSGLSTSFSSTDPFTPYTPGPQHQRRSSGNFAISLPSIPEDYDTPSSMSEPVADLPHSPSANSKRPHSESITWDFQSVMPQEIMTAKRKKPNDPGQRLRGISEDSAGGSHEPR